MATTTWREDDLRQEAERLVSTYGHLWPTRCEHLKCSLPFPRVFRKDQAKSGSQNIRRFRCAGCKTTLSVKAVLDTLRPIQHDPTAAAQVVSSILQPAGSSTTHARQSTHPKRQTNSLHVSDLDSIPEDDNMSEVSQQDLDAEDDSSLLYHYPSNRPAYFQTPPPQQQGFGTQVFGSPLPPQYLSSPHPQQVFPNVSHFPSPNMPSFPSQFSSWPLDQQSQPLASQSASLHPSQWSYMSGGTPVHGYSQPPPSQPQMPASQGATASPSQQAQQDPVSTPPEPPQGVSSVAAGKRRHMDASIWQQKHQRLDASPNTDAYAALQQAQAASERQAQFLMTANQNLQNQLQSLINEVAHLRQELHKSHQAAAAAAAAAPAPAPAEPSPVPPKSTPAVTVATAPLTATPAEVAAAVPASVVPPTSAAASVAPVAGTSAPVAAATYAGAARQGLTDAQLAIIQSMKPPPRPFKARQPANAAPQPQAAPVRIYFSGVQSGPLKVFKERLRALRIRTSQIYNISFIGKAICEFMIDASYKDKFIESMESFTFRYLPNFDPAVPQDPNVTDETRDLLKQAYTRRLTAMASTTNRGFVRDAFLSMLTASGAPVPTNLPPLTSTGADIAPGTSAQHAAAFAAPTAAPTRPTETESDITMEPAAEDTAGANDEGNLVRPTACDPSTPPSPSNE
jgi:hypothetical protein